MKFTRHIPLYLVILIALNSLYKYYTTNLEYEIRHYLCFVLIALAITFLVLKKKKTSFNITLFILLLSTFDLLRYSFITHKIRIGGIINNVDLGISIQTRSLLFLVLFIILNRDYFVFKKHQV